MLTALPCLLLTLQQPSTGEAPRLVVLIAVDQLIPEQLQRLEPVLTGGFKRFLDEGAVFWRATVDYAATETGPGHATLATGRYPSSHGIIGNVFTAGPSQQIVYCVGDGEAKEVTSNGISATGNSNSPALLIGGALGDLIEEQMPGSKAISVSAKDRSAVLMGGRQPDAALWWNGASGGFASSTYYGDQLPEFASVWNAAWRERARGWKWESTVPGDPSVLGTAQDNRVGESSGGRTLPRTLSTEDGALPNAVVGSPLIDFFTLELATLALQTEGLGDDETVDFLGLSLSGCDILGHGNGPFSLEVTDLLLRNDRDLGRFLALLDEEVGKGRWIACLSSDHGVLDLPEGLQARGIGARRVRSSEVASMTNDVLEAAAALYPDSGDLGLRAFELGFVFDEARVLAAGIDPAELRELIAEVGRETKWIADAYTREDLTAEEPRDAWVPLYRRCLAPGRGVDVVMRPEPWLAFELAEGTSHGSPYPYDRRVPLAFLGGSVRPQQRFDAASPTDAVPTLLTLLELTLPGDLDGRTLKVD